MRSAKGHDSERKRGRNARQAMRRRDKRLRAKERRRKLDAVAEHGDAGYGSCARKHRHATEVHALRKALECMRCGSPALWVYRCPYCGGWHLTSHPKGKGGEI